MITNEAELRVALQTALASVLALEGYWGCALIVIVILLPWKPILAVMEYLAQPIVDWRIQKARDRCGKGTAQIERELDDLLRLPRTLPVDCSHSPWGRPRIFSKHVLALPGPATAGTVKDRSATLAVRPAISHHVHNTPQGLFANMQLEVEDVKFQGDRAEAYVKFQSLNVTELIFRQRYVLRKSGDQWKVETREFAKMAKF